MTELAVTLLRLGYLALLWLFVLSVVAVLRRDIFGTRITTRAAGARPGRKPRGRSARRRDAGGSRATEPSRKSLTRLVVTAGPLSGTTVPLGGSSIVVGRSPACTLVLEDDYASGRHARFFPRDDTWWVEDLGSTNGTLVAEQPVTAPVQLAAGVPVRIGRTVIELRR